MMKISPFHQIHPQQIAGFVINDGNTNQGHGGAKQHRGYGTQEAGCNAGFEGTEFVATADKEGVDPAAHLIGWQDLKDKLTSQYKDDRRKVLRPNGSKFKIGKLVHRYILTSSSHPPAEKYSHRGWP